MRPLPASVGKFRNRIRLYDDVRIFRVQVPIYYYCCVLRLILPDKIYVLYIRNATNLMLHVAALIIYIYIVRGSSLPAKLVLEFAKILLLTYTQKIFSGLQQSERRYYCMDDLYIFSLARTVSFQIILKMSKLLTIKDASKVPLSTMLSMSFKYK